MGRTTGQDRRQATRRAVWRAMLQGVRRVLPRSARRALLLAAPAAVCLLGAVALNCRCDQMQAPASADLPGVPIIRVLLTAGSAEEVTVSTTGAYALHADGTIVGQSDQPLQPVLVRREGQGWRIGSWLTAGRELVLLPGAGEYVRLGATTYRGHLRLLPADGESLIAVNHVDLESYLAGVLSKELYAGWHVEAYRALAVAARTFALYHMTTYGSRHEYDLGDSQASQVYGGLTGETARSREAVDTTRGIVLAYGQQGAERIFLAQYSACCGGRVNGAYVIRSAHHIEPLEGGQVCTDCRACARYRWGPVRIGKSDIYRALAERYAAAAPLGGLSSLQVVSETPYGRAVWVDAVGPTGRKLRLRAEDVRLALISHGPPAARGLYSMNCQMVDVGAAIEFRDGKGFGHGVGLCQWGAQAKAEMGWPAERILAFYYPGAKLYRAH